MAIIRTKRPTSFTVINNDLINDTRLDWRDLGLLTYLLSKPDNWEVSVAHLQKERKTGRYAIYESLKNLTAAGYVKGRAKQGGFEYEVFDVPTIHDAENHDAENHDGENHDADFHHRENPPQVNTDISINTDNKVNTDKSTNTEIVIMPPPENFVPPDECELTVEKLGGELQACFEWAKEHDFWNFVAHESISKFLKLYGNKKPDGLRAQFERRNDVKPKSANRNEPPINIFAEQLKRENESVIDSIAAHISQQKIEGKS